MSIENDFYDDDVIDYRYYLELVRTTLLKYYKWIMVFCVVCIIASVLYVQSQAPVYVSTVTMHIAPEDMGVFSFEQFYWQDEDKFQDTQIGILQSKKLMRRVVKDLNLHERGKLTPASFDAGLASRLRAWLEGLTEEPVTVIAEEEDQIRSAAGELASLISIAKPPNREYSNLLNITVRMADPEMAAEAANAIAAQYMAMVFENEIDSATKNQQFLTDRLTVLREDLRIAENRLQDYREAEDIVERGSGATEVDEELTALANRYFEARETRLRQESAYRQVENLGRNNRGWDNIPAIANHRALTQLQSELFSLERRKSELSKRYGRRHNTMIALESEIQSAKDALSEQVNDVIAGIKSEFELAEKIESSAEQTLNEARGRRQQLGRKEFQLNDLVQDVETKREVYAIFLERLNQDGASGPVRNDNIWVADPAVVPKVGQRTSLQQAGIVAFILSFGFALGAGLLRELSSNTVSTGEDVERKLGKTLLGYLPLVDGKNTDVEGLTFYEYLENPESRFSEALRTIRTSISLSTLQAEGCTRLLVTSSQSSEGKTSVALGLSAAIGQTSRVLLIDGDLRKPSLERILMQTHHKQSGLSDVVANSVPLNEAIYRHPQAELDVLFSGSRTVRPLELLASKQFQDLMAQLSEKYETIVIDSPPCVSVSDAYIIATLADSMIFVTKSDQVAVPVIRNCLSRFANIDVEIAGVLVNQIDFNAVHYYAKYQDYYDYHGYGDSSSSEPHESKP
ncbi:MAG: polysaccharide biosynthesis tyrosine autokinase [Pseudomonadales bacterium]|nr:polysaccharide biosynthesis tyrosine autokinase [Pseudomonadales bacterium]MBO6594520.1 polysaccharide biosynthesis tyrosine autokinase [Pseudomonadales bacterium]MBO6821919.1 polysaccharide biosynthesis tyrosine autokinase [Pseudomonadales bacterium]